MPSEPTRRRYLQTVAAAGAVGLAGCSGGGPTSDAATATETAATPTETATRTTTLESAGVPDFGDHFDGVENYDGTVTDLRGRDTVTVEVGVTGNGGAFAFGPPAVHVDAGTTVLFKWTGEGGAHTVASVDDGPLESGDAVAEPGVNYEYTFATDGIYDYSCAPHRSLGMRGSVVVGTDYPTVESTDS